ncbi:MAG: AraC family transcriptional regulator [Clostridia bacterium]|nr:AraC family transcriptional regulator [Clostridia bacterium]
MTTHIKTYIHETHIFPDSRMPFFFHKDSIKKIKAMANWHDNIELLCFTDGEGYLNYDSGRFRVKAGDVAIINPNAIHLCESENGNDLIYYCLIIDTAFCEANGIDILSMRFSEVAHGNRELAGIFEELNRNFSRARVNHGNLPDRLAVYRDIMGILTILCRDYLADDESDSVDQRSRAVASGRVKKVMTYMQNHFSEPITLDEVAEHVGVSKYHLSREFKLFTGMTIFDSLNLLRCKEARHMLTGGATVTEAATTCGFENLSYFSRTFKRHIGKLPSEYVKGRNE